MDKVIKIVLYAVFGFWCSSLIAQTSSVTGNVRSHGMVQPFVNVYLNNTTKGVSTNEEGYFKITDITPAAYTLVVSAIGYKTLTVRIKLDPREVKHLNLELEPSAEVLEETVVTGTLKPVNRLDSPVPVEVYSPAFLKQNPTASIFEALQNVNGVRPQINCNVCNTGDIHINGLEGPYTLVLIDGMPIVSGLGTVYGLSGIPNSLIEQIEIVKGPASSLYGSEAVGGLINIITKNTLSAPEFSTDAFVTGWGEYNLDVGAKVNINKNTDLLLGVNYFNYDQIQDNNNDNFTDLTLQNRVSIFNKLNIKRKKSRVFTLAGRFFYEDRWGGELQWTPEYRGSDEIYGESIFTRRWEVLSKYQLPTEEDLMLSISYNNHHQNSVYGDIPYIADQRIGFSQLTWDKSFDKHDWLFGTALRYQYYNDNTPATANTADEVWIPSLFAQDEVKFGKKQVLLMGLRYDYDKRHGSIYTPRLAYRYKFSEQEILRFNLGTGFRVVNLFTEEHAALTGSRDVIIAEELKPEQSINANLNFLKKFYFDNGTFVGIDVSAFYTRFNNIIIPDYDTDPNKIIYDNLHGKSISQGVSGNLDIVFNNGIKLGAGITLQDVSNTEDGEKNRQILTESYSGTWNLSYTLHQLKLSLDYSGNVYGPMRLPLLGDLDPRLAYSPTWSIQNIQFTYKGFKNFEAYGGVKNLLNWTPNKGNPFIIARANDPFDKAVDFDTNGQAIATTNNPYALTFDPSYVYGPNQGIRGFFGLRYTIY